MFIEEKPFENNITITTLTTYFDKRFDQRGRTTHWNYCQHVEL